MPSPSVSIVCESRRQSIPFPFQSLPESERWNRSAPPYPLVKAAREAAWTIPQFLRTSKSGRSLREARDFLRATCPRPAGGLRYRFLRKTSESVGPVHRKADCNGSETTGIDRLFAVRAARSPKEFLVKIQSGVSPEASRNLLDGRPVRESPSSPDLPSRAPSNRVLSGSHTQHCHPALRRQWSEVLHRPSAGVVPPTS